MAILAGPVLTIWVGAEYASYAGIVGILTLAGFLDLKTWPAGTVLQGMAKHQILTLFSVAAGIGNLTLSIILVQRIGLTGVALGTLIPITINLVILMPYMMHVIGISPSRLVKETLLPAIVPALPMFSVLIFLRETFSPASLISLGLIASCSAVVYGLGYLIVGASQFEKDMYRGYVSNLLRWVKSSR